MKGRLCQGFILAEFVIAVVFVAMVLGPLLLFVSRIQDLNTAVGQQSRREAWRSFGDQAIVAGMDPGHTPSLSSDRNPAIAPRPPPTIRELAMPTAPGLPRIIPLQAVLEASVAEPRVAGSGFRLGSGAAVAPLVTPQPPLIPITLATPEISPPDGSDVAISALRATGAGEPYTLLVQASSLKGGRILARLNRPTVSFSGVGTAQHTITAVDLLNGVSGIAWVEYAGDPLHGDRAIQLEDGRVRWLVPTRDGRRQSHEPSGFVTFVYRIDLGIPVFVSAAGESPSGGSIPFDYARYASVQHGAEMLHIDFPNAIKAAFGNYWPAASVGFAWTFGSTPGPFSGNAQPLFLPGAIEFWSDSVSVAATPVLPEGATAASGVWTFTRTKTPLGAPILSTTADSTGFFAPGALQFIAPSTEGSIVGRLSFESGAFTSTGATLSVDLIP